MGEVVLFAKPGTFPRRWKGARIAPEIFLSFDCPHPLVEGTARSLRTAQTDSYGYLPLPSTSPLPVRVRKGSVEKALRLADALIKAWLREGKVNQIRPFTEGDPCAVLLAGAVELRFAVSEEADGRLCLELSGERVSRRRSFRRRLREKRRLSLEAWTGRILQVAVSYVERRTQVVLELEREQRELKCWEEDCERRAREQEATVQRWQEERRMTEALLKGESEWRRAKEFLEFIAACRVRMIEKGEVPALIDRWVEWAEKAGRTSPKPETWIEQTIDETRELRVEGEAAA